MGHPVQDEGVAGDDQPVVLVEAGGRAPLLQGEREVWQFPSLQGVTSGQGTGTEDVAGQ